MKKEILRILIESVKDMVKLNWLLYGIIMSISIIFLVFKNEGFGFSYFIVGFVSLLFLITHLNIWRGLVNKKYPYKRRRK